MASQKRIALSLEERVQVIKSLERGESSRSIAERLGVGRTQIQTKIKRNADVLSEFETDNCCAKTNYRFLFNKSMKTVDHMSRVGVVL